MATSRRMRKIVSSLLALAIAGSGLAAGAATVARGEEQGMTIKLSYIDGYSNAGPTNVYGTLRLWPTDGVAALDAHDLPRQEHGATYVSWIVNTATGEAMRLGAFNSDNAGDASQDINFDTALPQGANAVVVTIQHAGDPAGALSAARTLAGNFPPLHSAPTPAPPPAATSTPPAPVTPSGPRTPAQKPTQRGQRGSGAASGQTTQRQQPKQAIPATRPPVVILPKTGGGPAAAHALMRCKGRSHCPRGMH